MPVVVGDVGGLAFFAWTTMLYVAGSLFCASAGAVLLFRFCPRAAYRIAYGVVLRGRLGGLIGPGLGGPPVGGLAPGLRGGGVAGDRGGDVAGPRLRYHPPDVSGFPARPSHFSGGVSLGDGGADGTVHRRDIRALGGLARRLLDRRCDRTRLYRRIPPCTAG